MLINSFVPNAALIGGRGLFRGGAYSSKYGSLCTTLLAYDRWATASGHARVRCETDQSDKEWQMTKHKKYFSLASVWKRVFVRNHSYENVGHQHVHFYANQKIHFITNTLAKRLVLKQRQKVAWKWPKHTSGAKNVRRPYSKARWPNG